MNPFNLFASKFSFATNRSVIVAALLFCSASLFAESIEGLMRALQERSMGSGRGVLVMPYNEQGQTTVLPPDGFYGDVSFYDDPLVQTRATTLINWLVNNAWSLAGTYTSSSSPEDADANGLMPNLLGGLGGSYSGLTTSQRITFAVTLINQMEWYRAFASTVIADGSAIDSSASCILRSNGTPDPPDATGLANSNYGSNFGYIPRRNGWYSCLYL